MYKSPPERWFRFILLAVVLPFCVLLAVLAYLLYRIAYSL
jgi:hypothetical protein